MSEGGSVYLCVFRYSRAVSKCMCVCVCACVCVSIRGLSVRRISESDPRVVAAKADPTVQVYVWVCGHILHAKIVLTWFICQMGYCSEVAEKMTLLIQASSSNTSLLRRG